MNNDHVCAISCVSSYLFRSYWVIYQLLTIVDEHVKMYIYWKRVSLTICPVVLLIYISNFKKNKYDTLSEQSWRIWIYKWFVLLVQKLSTYLKCACFLGHLVYGYGYMDMEGGIYDHEHEVFMECEALKEAANSLATHDNLL